MVGAEELEYAALPACQLGRVAGNEAAVVRPWPILRPLAEAGVARVSADVADEPEEVCVTGDGDVSISASEDRAAATVERVEPLCVPAVDQVHSACERVGRRVHEQVVVRAQKRVRQ